MKKNKVHILPELKSDLKDYSAEISRKLAKQVRQELLETAKEAISLFYLDYTPLRYHRHYYNFLEKSFRGYYKNPHNQIIRGGIELTPYLMDDIYGKQNHNVTDIVFNLVYSGYHGNISATGYGQEIQPMKPNPIDIIYKKRRYIVENIQSFKKKVNLKPSEGSYKTLRF